MTASVTLRGSDARAALELAGELASAMIAEDLRTAMLTLPEVVGADGLLDARIDSARDGALQMAADFNDPTIYQSMAVDVVTRQWKRHPIIARHVRRPTVRPIMVSDFMTGAEWRRNVVFNEAFRPLGLHDELAIQISWATGRTTCVALHRADGAFTERDRAMLDAVAPHARAAYRRVAAHTALRDRARLLESGLEAAGGVAIVVSPSARVIAANVAARRLLREWFGADRTPGDRLPGALADWHAVARRQEATARLVRATPGRRLEVSIVAGQAEDVLVLREQHDAPVSAAALTAALPLSLREAEVLALLITGLTNIAIARRLELSPRTVGHHIERIFARLETPNRAAATATALAALHQASDR